MLHVGWFGRPLAPPTTAWQVAVTAFEIARRHRFARDLAAVPQGVRVHVLPTGEPEPPSPHSLEQFRYRDFRKVRRRIAQAYQATDAYLRRIG